MYSFSYYKEQDPNKVIDFIQQHAFALITGHGETYPVATQIPLVIKINGDQIILQGHMMKKTDHQLAFEKNNQVLVVFTGPNCFVNAGWYTDPKMGSTWNYMTVHAKGKISFMDEAETRNVVKAISDKFVGINAESSYDHLPNEYIDHMVKAIVGFSIEVESIDHVFKLSQNRDKNSQLNIIDQLRKTGEPNSAAIALEMEKRL